MTDNSIVLKDEVILRGEALHKSFPGVKALDGVDIQVRRGEILGICGENGAGKSTLMKIFSGVYSPDSGQLIYDGQEVHFTSPAAGIAMGICTIHQELSYISDLTVAENIFLESRPLRHGLIDWNQMYSDADALLEKFGLNLSSHVRMRGLPTATKQLIEIIRAINANSQVLIMDEPTSSLGIDETKKLMSMIHEVKNRGLTVILISHRLEELFEICDRLSVMRDGQLIRSFQRSEFDRTEVVTAMIGRRLTQLYSKEEIPLGETVFEFKNLSCRGLTNVSLQVHAGEIVGLYGMVGAGQDEVMNVAFGLNKPISGEILLDGKPLIIRSPSDAVRHGLAYLTAERKQDGLILAHSIQENIVLAAINDTLIAKLVSYKKQREISCYWKAELGIKASGVEMSAGVLSGGNQQKVVLAKWLQTNPRVLLMNEPTRGVDIGAKQEIYAIIQRLCKAGMAVIMISSDMPEMLNIADNIYTICSGNITGRFKQSEATQYKLMLAAIGMEDTDSAE